MIVMGDFNLPLIDWHNYYAPADPVHDIFMSCINDNGFHQYVSQPTRGDNILDLLLTFNTYLVSDVSILNPFSTSDHNMIEFSINTDFRIHSDDSCSYFYDFKMTDYAAFKDFLSSINWDLEFSYVFTVEQYWHIFASYLQRGIELFVPRRKVKPVKLTNRKIYPRYLRLMFNRKAVLWKRWQISKLNADKQTYKNYAVRCRSELYKFQCAKELDMIDKRNVNKFYKFVNHRLGKTRTVQPILDSSTNSLVTDPLKQANILNDHFGSVFTVDSDVTPSFPARANGEALSSVSFSVAKVRKALTSLKSSFSSGPDGFPNVLLKTLANQVCVPLSYIFQASFVSGEIPQLCLQAIVTPVFKQGITSDPSNYRPISLTCTSCRVMERIANIELINYLFKHKLISKHQHGFLKRRSIDTNLIEALNDWTLALEKKACY